MPVTFLPLRKGISLLELSYYGNEMRHILDNILCKY